MVNLQQIPQTDSIVQLAHFWDTHDLTEFENQLEEETTPILERKAKIIVHLRPEEAWAVRERAASIGIVEEEMIRQWILEKLLLTEAD